MHDSIKFIIAAVAGAIVPGPLGIIAAATSLRFVAGVEQRLEGNRGADQEHRVPGLDAEEVGGAVRAPIPVEHPPPGAEVVAGEHREAANVGVAAEPRDDANAPPAEGGAGAGGALARLPARDDEDGADYWEIRNVGGVRVFPALAARIVLTNEGRPLTKEEHARLVAEACRLAKAKGVRATQVVMNTINAAIVTLQNNVAMIPATETVALAQRRISDHANGLPLVNHTRWVVMSTAQRCDPINWVYWFEQKWAELNARPNPFPGK